MIPTSTDIANNIAAIAVGVPSVGVIIAFAWSLIKRRIQADAKSLNEDKSYQDMLNSYKSERDETRADRDRIITRMTIIENERNEAVGKVGKLTAEVTFLSTQVTELKALVERLGTSLELARAEMHKFAVDNAKLSAHVSYLEELVERNNEKNSPPNPAFNEI